jgi:hypothetical protein
MRQYIQMKATPMTSPITLESEVGTFHAWDGMKGTVGYYDPKYGKHHKVSPDEWWQSAVGLDLHLNPGGLVRMRVGASGTFPLPICSVPEFCQKHLTEKIAFSVAIMKKGGQCEGDMDYPLLRVIDLDTDTVATDEQFLAVSKMFPDALLIRSNGIQIFLELSGLSWQAEAQLLAAMGTKAAEASGLKYDAHHLLKTGLSAAVQHHLYRTPWGHASRADREVWCFEPWGNIANVQQAAEALGIMVSPVMTAAPTASPMPAVNAGSTRRKPVSPKGTGGSRLSERGKHQEFSEIMAVLRSLVKSGLTEDQAYRQILARTWQHYDTDAIARTVNHIRSHPTYALYPIYRGGAGGGGSMSEEEFEGFMRDQELALTRLGPISRKRRKSQKTFNFYAERAWAFQWLFKYGKYCGVTVDQAVDAFFTWPIFEEIKDVSVANLGRDRVEKDLRRCWVKFYDFVQLPADPALISAVKQAIADLITVRLALGTTGSFRTTELLPLVPVVQSKRHLQRILAMLVEDGYLGKASSGRWTTWHISTRHTLIETKTEERKEEGQSPAPAVEAQAAPGAQTQPSEIAQPAIKAIPAATEVTPASENIPLDNSGLVEWSKEWIVWRREQISLKSEAEDDQLRAEGYPESYIRALSKPLGRGGWALRLKNNPCD